MSGFDVVTVVEAPFERVRADVKITSVLPKAGKAVIECVCEVGNHRNRISSRLQSIGKVIVMLIAQAA